MFLILSVVILLKFVTIPTASTSFSFLLFLVYSVFSFRYFFTSSRFSIVNKIASAYFIFHLQLPQALWVLLDFYSI